jgi:hypothetical protein
MSNKSHPEFHHITLETRLKYSEDYKRLLLASDSWHLPSSKNKAKVFKCPYSRHREYTIIVYPSGVVMILIEASFHPYSWYSHEDWMQLREICGSILQRFKDSLSIEPLIHDSVADWLVKQLDINYDIPMSSLDNCKSLSSKGSLLIPRLFDGSLKVTHLDRIYQVYNKQLPYNGNCIRAEEQLHFPSPSNSTSPNLSSLNKTVIPPTLEHIINIVVPSPSPLTVNNPLHYLRDLER